MNFNIYRFVRTNKVIFIWCAFAILLYLFRQMFGLVFITYVMCFIMHSIISPVQHIGSRKLWVVAAYSIFLTLLGVFLFFFTPTLLAETKHFTEQLPGALKVIDRWIEANSAEYEWLPPLATQIKEYLTPEQLILQGWGMGRAMLEKGLHYTSWFFLGLLFSFLIMLDLPSIGESVRNLRNSRLSAVYRETSGSVILFARVVGENFRAQMLVSAINTCLTAIGIAMLGIGGSVLLCTLVFLCGLIPVLGVFLSSVPIFLMAVNTGGITLGLWVIVMIIIIHMIEAYFLNPRIVSAVMHINPVMTLMILYIAHSLAGLWGMLLGVPVSVYIYRQLVERKEVSAD